MGTVNRCPSSFLMIMSLEQDNDSMKRFLIIMLIAVAFVMTIRTPVISTADELNPALQKCRTSKTISMDIIPVFRYEIVNRYPHDSNAFTQGLAFYDGFLYEGTGLQGRSSLRKVELESGDILKILKLPNHIFGEGIVVCSDKITQLTWRSKVGFVYDRDSFTLLQKFSYATEGWGITSDGERLMISDGSAIIYFRDLENFREIGKIRVCDENGPVKRLNELEYIKDEIYANVWKTERIARIAPDTGKVTGWIDLEGISLQEGPIKPVDVLNGIAYDAVKDRLFVTGKLWPKVYEIKLVEK